MQIFQGGLYFHQVTVEGATLSHVGKALAGQLIHPAVVWHEAGPVKTLDDCHTGRCVLCQASREVTLPPGR